MALKEVELHPTDQRELVILRKDLIGWRHIQKLTQDALGVKSGMSGDVIGNLEAGPNQTGCLLSLWQNAATGLGGKLVWNLDALPEPEVNDELKMLTVLAQTNPGLKWDGMLLVGILRQLRKQLGMSSADVAARLGIKSGSLSDWEIRTADPAIPRVMAFARVLGGRFRVRLVVD